MTTLTLGVDRGERQKYFVAELFQHPAKLHLGLLAWLIDRYTAPVIPLATRWPALAR